MKISVFEKSCFSVIHLSPDYVSFLGKDVLEISELKSNLIIRNLYNFSFVSP